MSVNLSANVQWPRWGYLTESARLYVYCSTKPIGFTMKTTPYKVISIQNISVLSYESVPHYPFLLYTVPFRVI